MLVAAIVLAASLAPGPAARVQAAPACSFQLGFASMAAAIPQHVGQCVENESHAAANGDALQRTSGGLLVWRKADNWTAFTDGYHTWVAGPDGVQERLNTQRFAWEADPDGLPVVGVITAPAGVVVLGGGLERADYPTLGLRVVYPAAVTAASLAEFVTNWQAADVVVRARLVVATPAPMTVELCADGAAAPLGLGVRGFSAPGQGRMYQLYDGSGDPGDRADITAHELGHMRMYLRDGEGANAMLREGVAMYASEPFLQRDGLVTLHDFAQAAYQEHRLVPLATLSTPDAAFDGRLLDRLDYDLAGSFVAYLIEHYGLAAFDRAYPAADYAAAYGKSLGQLEQEWIAFLADRTKRQPLAFDPMTYFAALDRLHRDYVRLFALAAQHDGHLDGPAYRALDAARLAVDRHDAAAAQRQLQLAEAAPD